MTTSKAGTQAGDQRRIIKEAARGDAAAYEYLFRKYSSYTRRVIVRRLRDTRDTDDINQEVWIKVYLFCKLAIKTPP